MNQLVKVNETTALATYGATDPFEAFANLLAPRTIVGKILKFSKGDYLAGEESELIPAGTVLTANVAELVTGWVKWAGGKPVEHIMVRVADGRKQAQRNELGDLDQTLWELDSAGTPRDPWQYTSYLPLLSADGELFTFASNSKGGRAAVADLCRLYARRKRNAEELLPIIALEVGSYQHSNREYGRIKFPKFGLAGWAPKAEFDEALAAAGFMPAMAPAPEEEPPSSLNDDIPY